MVNISEKLQDFKVNIQDNALISELLDHCNDGINIVNEEGRIIYVNEISAEYAGAVRSDMIGRHIFLYYPKAVLLKVLKSKKPVIDQKIHYIGGKNYIVSSYPIFDEGKLMGAYSIFKDVRDIEVLNRRIQSLELKLTLNAIEDDPMAVIGKDGSLEAVLRASKRTVGSLGGPRHSIIIGESGTGKTMLARMIYNYAVQVGVLQKNAPFVEINCAQYTNSDIAAVEIFGSEEGAYTGSKQKKGLFEQANGGILFLDEAHALEGYQNILLKVVESGKIRRVGGHREIAVDVIIIAASTRNLKKELLPELYQRLGQYELNLPSLSDRSLSEKDSLIQHFIQKYEEAVKSCRGIEYSVSLSEAARRALLEAHYPRNIRQLRDVINSSIDAASPLINEVQDQTSISIEVDIDHLPFECSEEVIEQSERLMASSEDPQERIKADPQDASLQRRIHEMVNEGLGPRKIARALNQQGVQIEYYQVAYMMKKWK